MRRRGVLAGLVAVPSVRPATPGHAGAADPFAADPFAADPFGGAADPGAGAADPVPAPTRAQVIESMRLVDTFWIANGADQAANNWQNAMFNMGNLAYVTVFGKTNGDTLPWSRRNMFLLPTDPARPFLAENFATGEAYLDLYRFHPVPETLAALRERVAAQTAAVPAGQVREWDHAEALGLAMPAFAPLAAMAGTPEELAAMHRPFRFAARPRYAA